MMYESSLLVFVVSDFFFFKQKTAYELRISDWSSDVCSSDLADTDSHNFRTQFPERRRGDLIGRAIRAIDHDLQAIETKVRRQAGINRMDIAHSRVLNAPGPTYNLCPGQGTHACHTRLHFLFVSTSNFITI